MPDITKIPAPRVPVLDPVTGLMTREWYRFFYNLFVLTSDGETDVSIDDLLKGPPADAALSELGTDLQSAALSDAGVDALAQIADLQTQVQSTAVTPPDSVAAELEKQLQALAAEPPDSVTAELEKQLQALSIERPDTVAAELEKQLQALSVQPRPELGTMSSVNIDWVPYIGFDTAPPWIGTTAGQFWYDSTTGSFNAKMGNNNITQQVGEEFFRYGKASAAISDVNLTAVYKTGTVGASGVITFAPTVAGITRADQILGIATESLNINDFGRITTSGVVRGINTTGSVYGESWADNDDIWYNPATGGLTKIKPAAPNIKVMLGTVIKAGSGGSGSFFVNIGTSSELGGTDSNVQITSPTNGQSLVYVSANSRWENAAVSASTLEGYTWASPGAIGVTTPAPGKFTNLTTTGYADIQGSTAQINVTWEGTTYTAAAALNSSNAAQFGLLGTSNTLNCYGITGYNSNTSGGAGVAGLGRYGVLGRALPGAANSNGVRGEASSTSGSIGTYGGAGASGTYGVWAYGGASGTALYVDGTMQITDTTLVTNLNADRLDGQHGSYYQPASTAITTSNIGSQSVAYADDAGTLDGKTWAAPGAIGGTTATTGRFTRVTATGVNNVGLVLPIIASGQPLPALVTGGATYHIDYGLIICDGSNWFSVNASPGWVVI